MSDKARTQALLIHGEQPPLAWRRKRRILGTVPARQPGEGKGIER